MLAKLNQKLTDSQISSSPGTSSCPPLVSILLCTLNGAEFLREQLTSIALQDHGQWQLIVSDDGSKDATRDIVAEFGAAQINKARVELRNGPSRGAAANFLSLATDQTIQSDYFAYCDQDDIWLPGKLSRALGFLEKVPRHIPALYCSRTQLVDATRKPYGLSPLFKRPPSFANAIVQNIGGGNTMVFNMAARDLIASATQHEIIAHDWWTYMLVAGAGGRTFYDPQPSLKYRQHGKNQVGANTGFIAKMKRVAMVLEGRFSNWNAINCRALETCTSMLAEENKQILRQFKQLRTSRSPVQRLEILKKSGIHRQTKSSNVALQLSSLLGKV